MKIYVASSWRNEYQPGVVKALREAGHEVYDFRNPKDGDSGFGWSQIDPDWENWTTKEYIQALNHPLAVKGFKSDYDAMQWCDVCVMVLPCGRSANTEAGWLKGSGRKVFVYVPIPQEPELMYKIYDGITGSLTELLSLLTNNESEHTKLLLPGEEQNKLWIEANSLYSKKEHSQDGRNLQMGNFIITRLKSLLPRKDMEYKCPECGQTPPITGRLDDEYNACDACGTKWNPKLVNNKEEK